MGTGSVGTGRAQGRQWLYLLLHWLFSAQAIYLGYLLISVLAGKGLHIRPCSLIQSSELGSKDHCWSCSQLYPSLLPAVPLCSKRPNRRRASNAPLGEQCSLQSVPPQCCNGTAPAPVVTVCCQHWRCFTETCVTLAHSKGDRIGS